MSDFDWTPRRSDAAVMLAKGCTNKETAEAVGVAERTIERWRADTEFMAEVDRLSVMVDLANRAERLRLAQRVVRRMEERTGRDLLDWLRFIQSETDGAKLDGGFIEKLAALLSSGEGAPDVAPAESAGATGGDARAGATPDSATPDGASAPDPA
jgi:hypothetical protein